MFSENEKEIIGNFYSNLNEYVGRKVKLSWNSGFIIAEYDTCFDDFADDNESDEFTSFVFKVLSKNGIVPVEISEDNYCIVNYHNFPNEIIIDG